tara:strand:+ start:526 stop:681 length:156 start_codon:yes stop_codon:yes gene_type:complete
MDDLDIQILFDDIGKALTERGHTPDEIEQYLAEEADRVADEIRHYYFKKEQ